MSAINIVEYNIFLSFFSFKFLKSTSMAHVQNQNVNYFTFFYLIFVVILDCFHLHLKLLEK